MPLRFSPEAKAIMRRFNVHITGRGSTTLLFCNGYSCTQQVWHYLAPTLAAQYRLVFFDQVGTGQADPTLYDPQKYASLNGYAEDVVTICQALNLSQTIIVGHSEGAMVALLATIQAPQYFARALLLAFSPCHINRPGYYGGFDETDLRELLASAGNDYWHWATALAFMLMGEGQSAALGHELATHFCQADLTIAKQAAYATFLSDHRTDLARVSVPTHLIQCADDVAVPAEVNTYLLASLPQATLTLLSTTGHCPHLSVPLQVLAAMQALLP
ncbi:MAG: alpha/beta hydrolase [Hymenobacter sp.]|nr:MAG: alpha/beta hydrolase [Hymenobacter sp.]